MTRRDRPDVPEHVVRRIGQVLNRLPECGEDAAWVGVHWQVRSATVAHVFGGEDQLFRVVFRAGWGRNVVGLVIDDHTDWDELAELLTDSYCVQAPKELAARVPRPHDAPS